jgi:hypothetical protein
MANKKRKRNMTVPLTANEPEEERKTIVQSGDMQALSDVAEADSESVKELLEEGQTFEAEAVRAVEDAPDPDQAEVTTKQLPVDDVPPEEFDPDEPPVRS